MELTILRFDSIDSTNSEAMRQARLGAAEGLWVTAGEQTAGRGRQGREWVSSAGRGIYASVVLRPTLDAAYLSLITLGAAVAVHNTLTSLGLSPDIKWPNDVLIDERKISGILAEAADTKQGLVVVLGIGINVFPVIDRSIPLRSAASLAELLPAIPNPNALLDVLIRNVVAIYDALISPGGPQEIIAMWCERSSYYSGKRVRVTVNGNDLTGKTDGLESDGALRLRSDEGELYTVHAGDVEQLRAR